MNVIVLTVFIGLVLVAFFIALFLYVSAHGRGRHEHDSLLPLQDESPRPASRKHPL